jgi:hypothetical protein
VVWLKLVFWSNRQLHHSYPAWMPASAKMLSLIGLGWVVKLLGDGQEPLFQHSATHPVLESSMRGLVCAVLRRLILPRRTRAQNPQHAIQCWSPIAPRSTASIGPYRFFRRDVTDANAHFKLLLHAFVARQDPRSARILTLGDAPCSEWYRSARRLKASEY